MDDISDEELERRMREKLFPKDKSKWPSVETKRSRPKYELAKAHDGRWTVIRIENGKRTQLHSFPSQTSAWDYIHQLERDRN